MPELIESLRGSSLAFQILADHHDRAAFDCGEPSLNLFLQRQAKQNADRNLGVTHVVVGKPGDARILGYYTLVTRHIERDAMPRANRFPQDGIGVVLLGRLGVDKSAQGQRIGTAMLARAIEQIEGAAQTVGIHALVVHALNDHARDWYLKVGFGFAELMSNPRHLYLSIETIRKSGLLADE